MSESLRNYTSLHVGGPAKRFVHAKTEEELVAAVKDADASGEAVDYWRRLKYFDWR